MRYSGAKLVSITLIERKSRMLQVRGVKGEAVVNYCDPLTTQEMGYPRLSRRIIKMKILFNNLQLTYERIITC